MAQKRHNEIERTESKGSSKETMPEKRTPSGAMRPFGLLRTFANEIDDLFSDFGFRRWSGSQNFWRQIEVLRDKDEFVIRADVPGVKKDDLHVEVLDNELVISGERKEEHEEHEGEYYRSERSYGSFERRVPLPDGSTSEDVSCTFDNGTLEVRMKAPEQKRGRPIDIKNKEAA